MTDVKRVLGMMVEVDLQGLGAYTGLTPPQLTPAQQRAMVLLLNTALECALLADARREILGGLTHLYIES